MKLLVDMNLSAALGCFSCRRRHRSGTLVHDWRSSSARLGNHSLRESKDFLVLTHDLDFSAILAVTHGDKPSVVQIRADNLSLESIGNHVASALRQMVSELESGALLTIDPTRTRLRLLPLPSTD
jgi:predicted nuclease of predicted toxin-antitoxin system